MISVSTIVITLIGIITFCVILWIVYKFAGESTEAIKKLSDHAERIRNAKGIKEKKNAKNEIKKDPMFERQKLIMEKELLEELEKSKPLERAFTINKKH